MNKTRLLLGPSAFLIFLALGWSQAWGVQLADPKSHFSVDLDFPGASVCIAYPPSLRDDQTCKGVNFPAPEKDTKDFTVLGTGVIRYRHYVVPFYAQAVLAPHAGPINDKIAQDSLKGFLEGTAKRITSGPVSQIEAGMVTLKTQPVFRFLGDVAVTASKHIRLLYYVFSGEDHRFGVVLITGAENEKELRLVGAQFMDRVKVSPPTGSYGAENAAWKAKCWDVIIDSLYHLLIGVFFIWLLWKLGKVWLAHRRH